MTYQEALEVLKNRNSALKINHKIGSRDIANQELQEINIAINLILPKLQEAIDKASKYDELTEVKKIKRITPPFGDNVPINKYPKLFICPNCEIQINQFKDYKKFKCCPVCGQRIGV